MVLEGLSVQLQASTSVWECKLHNWILVKSEDRSKRMTSLAACDLQREHERQHRCFRISMILWRYCYIFHDNRCYCGWRSSKFLKVEREKIKRKNETLHSSIIYSNVAKLGMGRGGDYDYFYVKIEETFVWLCQNKGLRTCFWGGIVLPLLHHLLNGLPSNSKHLHALWRYVVHNNCGANIRGKSHHAVETMADKTCLQSSNAKSISNSKPKKILSGWVGPEKQPIPSK